jgi:hypothetical protein
LKVCFFTALFALSACGVPYGEDLLPPPPPIEEAATSNKTADDDGLSPPPPTTTKAPTTGRCDPHKPFGTPTLVSELDGARPLKGGYLSPDELEIFYLLDDAQGIAGTPPTFRHGTRASTDSPWQVRTDPPLTPPAMDLSSVAAGGLKLYYFATVNGASQLHVATRKARDGLFGNATLLSTTVTSAFVGDSMDFIYYQSFGTIYQASLTEQGGTDSDSAKAIITDLNVVRPILNAQQTTLRFQKDSNSIVVHRSSKLGSFSEAKVESSLGSDHGVTWTSNDDCVVYLLDSRSRHIHVSKRGL